MADLTGQTALVTGASHGIGRATAVTLAALGARVLVQYRTGAADAERVVAAIAQHGGRGEAVYADLAAADGAHRLATVVGSLADRLDILVANAGLYKAASIEDMSVEDFDGLFAVNVRAPFFLMQQLLPFMHQGGSIVFVSSLSAHAVFGAMAAYAASKGAVEILVKHIACALGSRGHPSERDRPGARGQRHRGAGADDPAPRPSPLDAGDSAFRSARRHCGCDCVPSVRGCAVDDGPDGERRRRLKALDASVPGAQRGKYRRETPRVNGGRIQGVYSMEYLPRPRGRISWERDMKILAISGSLQAQSKNVALLTAARRSAPPDVELIVFDGLRDLPHFNPDLEVDVAPESVVRWRQALASSDALLIASPEYGFSLPGVLKNAIDWVIGSGELERRVVAVTAAVPGPERGRRGLRALRDTLSAVRAEIVGGEPIQMGPEFERQVAALVADLAEAVKRRETTTGAASRIE